MNRILAKLITILILISSCTIFPERARERKIQSEIVSKLTNKSKKFSKCSRRSKIFNHFDSDRIRVVLHLSINSKGNVERFKLDDKNYPEKFANCIFKIVDLIKFPKIKNHEIIELEQPFIFSKE